MQNKTDQIRTKLQESIALVPQSELENDDDITIIYYFKYNAEKFEKKQVVNKA